MLQSGVDRRLCCARDGWIPVRLACANGSRYPAPCPSQCKLRRFPPSRIWMGPPASFFFSGWKTTDNAADPSWAGKTPRDGGCEAGKKKERKNRYRRISQCKHCRRENSPTTFPIPFRGQHFLCGIVFGETNAIAVSRSRRLGAVHVEGSRSPAGPETMRPRPTRTCRRSGSQVSSERWPATTSHVLPSLLSTSAVRGPCCGWMLSRFLFFCSRLDQVR